MPELNTFPVSFKVAGRRVVILGGGAEALAKARLLAMTSARVVVFAPEASADFSGLKVTLVARAPQADDLAGAALVFIAEHGEEGDRVRALARAAGIPVNEVDVPDNCDFFTPSIVERAPVSVAISTEGDAPVLARLVRARIEAALSPRLGDLALLAGRMRDKVAALLSEGPARRRYYEALVGDETVARAIEQGGGQAEAEALLGRHAEAGPGAGFVWLVGAGPGAADLLTLRAQRVLQEADVVVHDQLVPPAVVEMGRRDAARIAVGKAKGHHSFSQAQINTLIVRLAREGKRVARLKSGDPMVFGRAGEEVAALRKAGIGHAVVPGVTAALAAAADTGTPVTLRKVSSGVVFATAHGADDSELAHWAALAQSGITLGLYMGKTIAGDVAGRLIGHGVSGATPVGIVVNAGRPERTLHRGTLAALAGGEAAMDDGPAVILVGEAVAHGDWAEAAALISSAEKVA